MLGEDAGLFADIRRREGERLAAGIAYADELGGVSAREQQKAHRHHANKSIHKGNVMRSDLRMRTPSPQGGEGWGEGALTARPYPLTPPSPPWGEGEESGRARPLSASGGHRHRFPPLSLRRRS